MKQDRIATLYKGLDNKQRAALAFHYMTDANELEFERIASAVPLKSYTCPDIEYQAWLDSFTRLATFWAIEHWKTYVHKLTALAGVLVTLRRGDEDKTDALVEAHERWESRLLALDHALQAICGEHGIEPDAVRRLAGTESFVAMRPNLIPDAEYQAEMQANLARLLGKSACTNSI